MSAPDPADTLSNVLPSLPEGIAAVFDQRFPIEWTLQSRIWQDTIRAWNGRPGFALEEVARATEQDTIRKLYPERRFVEPLPLHETLPIPAIAAPVPYTELDEATLTREWDTGPGTAILTVDEEPPRHRLRDAGGRFVPAGGT